jgi:hypothetical protein
VAAEQGTKIIARNRRARFDYHIDDTVEAGLVLTGTEVKSLRAGRASLTDGFGQITDGEAFLHNVHIPEYTLGTWTNHEPRRTRKLLLHRKEIDRLAEATRERSTGWRPPLASAARRWSRCRCTSRTGGPRSSWRWPGASARTTSATTWPRRMRPGRSTVLCGGGGNGVADDVAHA